MSQRMVLWLDKPWRSHSVIGGVFDEVQASDGSYVLMAARPYDYIIFKESNVVHASIINADPNGCPYQIIDPDVYIINGEGMLP